MRQIQAAISFTAASALICVFLLHDSDHDFHSVLMIFESPQQALVDDIDLVFQLESVESSVHTLDVNDASYQSNDGWIKGAGKIGFGPYYYGDTKIYGGQVDSNGNEQPYPLYQNIQIDSSSGAKAKIFLVIIVEKDQII